MGQHAVHAVVVLATDDQGVLCKQGRATEPKVARLVVHFLCQQTEGTIVDPQNV